jgi:hypothetical protein
MNNKDQVFDKGGEAEEVLRAYFFAQGFYVVRGAKLKYASYDVTDIDLFLYARSSPYTRERCVVEAKKKRIPQAFERILWAKGLTQVLGFEKCFVATTDNRPEVARFAKENDVVVLDGDFQRRILGAMKTQEANRLFEEEFLAVLDAGSKDESRELRHIYELSKSRLLHRLNFDGFNECAYDVRNALENLRGRAPEAAALRILYSLISHLLLTFDYISQSLPNWELEHRRQKLADGFRYGENGRDRAEEIVNVTASLAVTLGGKYKNVAQSLREEIIRQYDSFPVEILAEFFAKAASLKSSFDMALAFEADAFRSKVRILESLTAEQRSIIGVLSDFNGFDRKSVFGAGLSEYKLPAEQGETKLDSPKTSQDNGELFKEGQA